MADTTRTPGTRYTVTARKYRPQTFDDLVAQEHVAETLRNAILRQRLAHAYLFSGPRGVGKTTAARILAKAVNCQTPLDQRPDAEPCRTCDSCRAFEEGRSLNIIEIDAASNNRVEDIRELRDTVRVPPQGANKKVYILDEVHMLSASAFNALLKTLEEPPEYALFIFATTEPHKVLPTILSRTQRFDFRRIAVPEIVARLQEISAAEGVTADDESLVLLARKGDGALRDALSIYDQAVSICGPALEIGPLRQALGVVDADVYFDATQRARAGDRAGLLAAVDGVVRGGHDLAEFVHGLADHLRNLLVARSTQSGDLIEGTLATKERYLDAAQPYAESDLLHLLMLAEETAGALRESRQPRLTLELALLKMASLEGAADLGRLLRRLNALETAARGGTLPPSPLTDVPASALSPSGPLAAAQAAASPAPPSQAPSPPSGPTAEAQATTPGGTPASGAGPSAGALGTPAAQATPPAAAPSGLPTGPSLSAPVASLPTSAPAPRPTTPPAPPTGGAAEPRDAPSYQAGGPTAGTPVAVIPPPALQRPAGGSAPPVSRASDQGPSPSAPAPPDASPGGSASPTSTASGQATDPGAAYGAPAGGPDATTARRPGSAPDRAAPAPSRVSEDRSDGAYDLPPLDAYETGRPPSGPPPGPDDEPPAPPAPPPRPSAPAAPGATPSRPALPKPVFGRPALQRPRGDGQNGPADLAGPSSGDGQPGPAPGAPADPLGPALASVTDAWPRFVAAIRDQVGIRVGAILKASSPFRVSRGAVEVAMDDAFGVKVASDNDERLAEVLAEVLGRPAPPLRWVEAPKETTETTAEADPFDALKQMRQSDPVVKALFESFAAEIVWQ